MRGEGADFQKLIKNECFPFLSGLIIRGGSWSGQSWPRSTPAHSLGRQDMVVPVETGDGPALSPGS